MCAVGRRPPPRASGVFADRVTCRCTAELCCPRPAPPPFGATPAVSYPSARPRTGRGRFRVPEREAVMPFHPHHPSRPRRPRPQAEDPLATHPPTTPVDHPLLYTPAEAAQLLKVRES